MAFSGGIFSRLYNWVNDKNASIDITASRMDSEMDGMATALSTCVLKDGTQTITANIPMSNFKFTGLGNGTAKTDAANVGQIQSGASAWGGTAGGTANAITLTPSPIITAYAAGQRFSFISSAANTGAVTINNSALGTRAITKNGAIALVANDIPSGAVITVIDDGTQYQLVNVQPYAHGADIASATTTVLDTATGDLVDVTGTTTITAITLAEGREKTVRFTGILTLTNGASLVLPGGANITTAAGDYAIFRGYASGVVRCVMYSPISALPLVLPAVASAIDGFLPSSIAGSNTTASLTVSAGHASDSTNAAIITKSNTTSWAASNGNAINGTDAASSTLANSTTYHFFICKGASGTGAFASASLTPTFPTGYTTYTRRIFSINTNVSGAPIPYTAIEIEGGGVMAWLATQVLDVNTAALTTARSLFTLTVPTGIKVSPVMRLVTATGANLTIISSPDETDIAPASAVTNVPGFDVNGSNVYSHQYLTTNTSGQIAARASAGSTTLYGTTRGFKDFRRA